jgi:hypothetical protein
MTNESPIKILGSENHIVQVTSTQIEHLPGQAFGGLGIVGKTRDGRDVRLHITSEALVPMFQTMRALSTMLGLETDK